MNMTTKPYTPTPEQARDLLDTLAKMYSVSDKTPENTAFWCEEGNRLLRLARGETV